VFFERDELCGKRNSTNLSELMTWMTRTAVSKRFAARRQRLAAFPGEGTPPADQACELLCEDHVGTYTLPYLCYWAKGTWRSVKTGEQVKAGVVGWRTAGKS
jgi:hypothetical protein